MKFGIFKKKQSIDYEERRKILMVMEDDYSRNFEIIDSYFDKTRKLSNASSDSGIVVSWPAWINIISSIYIFLLYLLTQFASNKRLLTSYLSRLSALPIDAEWKVGVMKWLLVQQ